MKQINFRLLSVVFICLSACTTPATPEKTPSPAPEVPTVGGDLDKHGCKPSAGYTWSAVKGECIRIFEAGIRLDPQEAVADKTTSAFVVFKSEDDDAKAEVFLPGAASSVILDRVPKKDDAGTWKLDTLTLTQWKGMYTLEGAKKQVLYQGHIMADK